jgi:uncharacterized membrane protein
VRQWTAFGSIVLLAAMCCGTQQAEAALKFCNLGNFKFVVATGYVDREKGWVARGWLQLEAGDCKDAIKAPLDNRYYYFHAAGRAPDQSLVKYSGETPFCVQSQKFELYQATYGKSSKEECGKDGLRSEMFMKIDVNNKPDWTINLGSPANGAAAGAGPATPPAGLPPAATGGPVQPPPNQPLPGNAGPPTLPPRPPSGPNGGYAQQPPNQPSPQNTGPAVAPPRPPSVAPGGGSTGAACQRYPNLC